MKNKKKPIRFRQLQQLQMMITMRQRFIAASICFIFTIAFIAYINLTGNEKSMAASPGDYRSKAAGNWSNIATWEKFNGLTWAPAIATPTSADGTITIQSGFPVTVTASVTADQVVVDPGGQLTVTTGTLTIANGTGTDLDVSGTVTITSTLSLSAGSAFNLAGTGSLGAAGTFTITGGALFTILNGATFTQNGGTQTTSGGWAVNNGGTYIHNANGKNIPTATWGASSTISITGVTTSDVSGLTQSFGNFVYNCTSQTASGLQFWDQLGSIQGNFTMQSTGTGTLFLQRISTAGTVQIGGNYLQTGGTVYMTKGAVYTEDITGNFTISGGTYIETERYGAPILNIHGNMLINGGTFNHSTYNSALPGEGIGTVNLYGNYSITSGSHTETATLTGRGDFNFAKTGTQTFSITGGSITNTVNFTVNSTSVLDLSTYAITSAGTFTLTSGGGLILASPNGITALGASGNVQVTGARSFSTGGDYTYNASSAQVTGSGLPATIHNLTVDNTSGLTMTSSSSATNLITLTNGVVRTGALNELGITNTSTTSIVGYSNANYVNGNLRRSTAGTGAYIFPLGTTTYYEPATIDLSGATGMTDILGTFTNADPLAVEFPLLNAYVGMTIITDLLNYGYWTFTPNSPMTGGTYGITLNEKGATNLDSDPQVYCVLKRANVLSSWASLGTHNNNTQSISSGVVTAARTALTGFSDFAIGKSVWGPLPVKLNYFKAKLNAGVVRLEWSTASEVNNNFFTVEKSQDGIHFEDLIRIPGAGNSTVTKNYKTYDAHPYSGVSYYRLRQTDFDGHFTFSKVEPVNNAADAFEGIDGMELNTVSPNPFSTGFSLSYTTAQAAEAEFLLQSASGEVLYREKIKSGQGVNNFEFTDSHHLKPGIYYAVIVCGSQRLMKKVVKS